MATIKQSLEIYTTGMPEVPELISDAFYAGASTMLVEIRRLALAPPEQFTKEMDLLVAEVQEYAKKMRKIGG